MIYLCGKLISSIQNFYSCFLFMIFGIIKHLCKGIGKMLIKKIVFVILSLSLVFMVSGCQSDKDNPLHGKIQMNE